MYNVYNKVPKFSNISESVDLSDSLNKTATEVCKPQLPLQKSAESAKVLKSDPLRSSTFVNEKTSSTVRSSVIDNGASATKGSVSVRSSVRDSLRQSVQG